MTTETVYTNTFDKIPKKNDIIKDAVTDETFTVEDFDAATDMAKLANGTEKNYQSLIYIKNDSKPSTPEGSEPAIAKNEEPSAENNGPAAETAENNPPSGGGKRRKTKRRKKTRKSKWDNKATVAVVATAVAIDKSSAPPTDAPEPMGGKITKRKRRLTTRKKPRRLKKRVR